MTDSEPKLIALPKELADSLIATGTARRRVSSQRSALTDIVLLSIGTAGSVVSLLQAPTTIRELHSSIRAYVDRHRAPLTLNAGGSGQEAPFTVTTDTDAHELMQYLDRILEQHPKAEVVVSVRDPNVQAPPEGWHHAEGDPQGTVRYWDGSLWRGDPVPKPD